MKIYISTFVKDIERLISGGTLVFRTLRKGFPNAKVIVTDNASIPEARKVIKQLCVSNDCEYVQSESEIRRDIFIKERINSNEGTVIFIDSDIMFWNKCEKWKIEGLFAGRYLPEYWENLTGCHTMPRIHPSFLWIPDCRRLSSKIKELQKTLWDFEPFHEYVFKKEHRWYRYDTIANLTSVFEDKIYKFKEKELNYYDHLFVGSLKVEQICNSLPEISNRNYKMFRDFAKDTRYKELKGLWKSQEKFFHVM